MTWVEQPPDGGSAVWGCFTCGHGAWCFDHTDAILEATTHAKRQHDGTVDVLGLKPGPKPDTNRDRRIRKMRTRGLTIRAIADKLNLSPAGVLKALRRTEA